MSNEIFIHGGSSLITKELINLLYYRFDKFYIFSRNINLTKSNLEKYMDKIILFENSLDNINQTFIDLKKLPNTINSVLWVSGYTGNALDEFNSTALCKKNIEVNFTNIVLSINYILNNKFKVEQSSFVCVLTSVAGMRGRNFNLFYGSAKAALISYLSGLRQKFYKKINVITVIPGYMSTNSSKNNTLNLLTSSPKKAANIIYSGIKNEKDIIYIDNKWKIIMYFVKAIPEFVFKKLKF